MSALANFRKTTAQIEVLYFSSRIVFLRDYRGSKFKKQITDSSKRNNKIFQWLSKKRFPEQFLLHVRGTSSIYLLHDVSKKEDAKSL